MTILDFQPNDENIGLWNIIDIYTTQKEGLRDIYIGDVYHVIESFWVEVVDNKTGEIMFFYTEQGGAEPKKVPIFVNQVEDDGNILTITGGGLEVVVILKDVGDDE